MQIGKPEEVCWRPCVVEFKQKLGIWCEWASIILSEISFFLMPLFAVYVSISTFRWQDSTYQPRPEESFLKMESKGGVKCYLLSLFEFIMYRFLYFAHVNRSALLLKNSPFAVNLWITQAFPKIVSLILQKSEGPPPPLSPCPLFRRTRFRIPDTPIKAKNPPRPTRALSLS